MNWFKRSKTIEELEAEQERVNLEANIAEKRAMARQMEQRYGKDWQKMFGGIKSGIDWNAVRFTLKKSR